MKNLLFAIGFSDYVQRVALYTAELANLAQARLILIYAYIPLKSPNKEEESSLCNERWVQSQLDKQARNIHKKTKASVTCLIKPGILQGVAFEIADKVKADAMIFCLKDGTDTTTLLPSLALTAQKNHYTIPILTLFFDTHPEPSDLRPALGGLLNLPGYDTSFHLEAIIRIPVPLKAALS